MSYHVLGHDNEYIATFEEPEEIVLLYGLADHTGFKRQKLLVDDVHVSHTEWSQLNEVLRLQRVEET